MDSHSYFIEEVKYKSDALVWHTQNMSNLEEVLSDVCDIMEITSKYDVDFARVSLEARKSLIEFISLSCSIRGKEPIDEN